MAWIPEGVKDLLGSECERKERLKQKLKQLFKSYGYRQVETPTFEYYDTFLEIKNTVNKDQTLKMIDQDGKILVLRPDATTPVVRMAAGRGGSAAGYEKYCYCMNVYRQNTEETQREMTQAGIEFLGDYAPERDSEVLALAIESLLAAGAHDFQIDIGQTEYVSGLLDGVEDSGAIRRHIANKNVLGLKDVLSALTLEKSRKEAILNLPYLYGTMEEVLQKARPVGKKAEQAVRSLEETYHFLRLLGYHTYVSFDLGMTQGIHYYTGMIFRGYLENFGRPVLSGGRYDDMLSTSPGFGGAGFGMDIDSLLEALLPDEEETAVTVMTDVLVAGKNPETVLQKCRELREKGSIVEAYFGGEADKVAKARHAKTIIRL